MLYETMLHRIRAEYREMPGLRLTLEQVQQLCGVERGLCQAILDALVDAKFLCIKADCTYARVTDNESFRRHPRDARFFALS